MATEKFQYVALPIPEYLVNFLCGKLRVNSETLESGAKATSLPITRRSFFGEFIYDNLRVAHRFNKAESNFYIKISDHAKRRKRGVPDTRNRLVSLPPSKYIIIEKMLRNALETELLNYIEGSAFAYEQIKGTRKGIVHKAIYDFMIKNGVPFSSTTFETLKKIYTRAKKRSKPLKTLTV